MDKKHPQNRRCRLQQESHLDGSKSLHSEGLRMRHEQSSLDKILKSFLHKLQDLQLFIFSFYILQQWLYSGSH